MFNTKPLPTSDFQRQIVILFNTPENSKCFDCQTRLPSYVNFTHGTFVCMLCSSLLRELGHQVKSIANPSFSAEEVRRMTQGGNNEAAKVWLNNWNQYQANNSLRLQDVSSIKLHLREKYIIKRWYREPMSSRSLSFSTSSLPPTSSSNSNPRAAPYNSEIEKRLTKPIISSNEVEDVMFVKSLPRPKKRTEIQRSYTTSFVDDFSRLNLQREPKTAVEQPQAAALDFFDAFVPQVANPVPAHSAQKHIPTSKAATQNFFDDNFTSCPFDFSNNFYQTQEPPLTQSAPQVNQIVGFHSKRHSTLITTNFPSTSVLQSSYTNNPFAEDTFGVNRNLSKPKCTPRPLNEIRESSTDSEWIAFP